MIVVKNEESLNIRLNRRDNRLLLTSANRFQELSVLPVDLLVVVEPRLGQHSSMLTNGKRIYHKPALRRGVCVVAYAW
jgi:hypothetical protein